MPEVLARWRRWAILVGAVSCSIAATLSFAPRCAAQFRDTIPDQSHYAGIEELYNGEYRNAQRTFLQSLRSSVKTLGPAGQVRWIDSVCYHAMLGETLFQWGRPEAALEQFNFACSMWLQYPNWLMQVEFNVPPRPDASLGRSTPPWGQSARQFILGKLPPSMGLAMGQIDNSNVVRSGGVVQQAQLWQVNVVEILRCMALAIRRRNEILGPLAPSDPMSRRLVLQLSRGGAPPNTWPTGWTSVLRGLAHSGMGEAPQAAQYLKQGLVLAGQFDHPLTGTALLELGRLAMASGNYAQAAEYFSEAGFSAFYYGDASVLDDSFRWGVENRFLSGEAIGAADPALALAAQWARRKRLSHVAARLNLAIAEELMAAHDWNGASAALGAATSLLGDARTGVLGTQAAYLTAILQCRTQRNNGPAQLAQAVASQAGISLTNFQLRLANQMFDQQTLASRAAGPIYASLLDDPTAADMVAHPLESMAVMATANEAAFDRWLSTALERKDLGATVEITDRAKRRRFHSAQALGGKLAAVRDLLCKPSDLLTAAEAQQRNDALLRFPDVRSAIERSDELRAQISATWTSEPSKDEQKKLASLWSKYAEALADREAFIRDVALERTPTTLTFPPLVPTVDLQSQLLPGQALAIFHDGSAGLMGVLITAEGATSWQCGQHGDVGAMTTALLRDFGNYDANREMTTDELASDKWRASSANLYEALFAGSNLAPEAVSELIIVPDGVTWYVPFEALWASGGGREATLISLTRIRYAPTAGLAFSHPGNWRRVRRTGLLVGEIVPGDAEENKAAAVTQLKEALPEPVELTRPSIAPAPAVATLLDALVVLADIDVEQNEPLAADPLPIDRSAATGGLDQWLTVARAGPQRMLLPGMHTLAERGGKASRRRGVAAPLGDDLFFTSCSLMSAGAETLLLSRWRVGGQSTLELMREFVREAPNASAADAWQRSVQVAMESPVDPVNELRVKTGKKITELTASHPFFWAGYLVVDSGWAPPLPEKEEAEVDAVEGVAAKAGLGEDGPPAPPAPPVAGEDATSAALDADAAKTGDSAVEGVGPEPGAAESPDAELESKNAKPKAKLPPPAPHDEK